MIPLGFNTTVSDFKPPLGERGRAPLGASLNTLQDTFQVLQRSTVIDDEFSGADGWWSTEYDSTNISVLPEKLDPSSHEVEPPNRSRDNAPQPTDVQLLQDNSVHSQPSFSEEVSESPHNLEASVSQLEVTPENQPIQRSTLESASVDLSSNQSASDLSATKTENSQGEDPALGPNSASQQNFNKSEINPGEGRIFTSTEVEQLALKESDTSSSNLQTLSNSDTVSSMGSLSVEALEDQLPVAVEENIPELNPSVISDRSTEIISDLVLDSSADDKKPEQNLLSKSKAQVEFDSVNEIQAKPPESQQAVDSSIDLQANTEIAKQTSAKEISSVAQVADTSAADEILDQTDNSQTILQDNSALSQISAIAETNTSEREGNKGITSVNASNTIKDNPISADQNLYSITEAIQLSESTQVNHAEIHQAINGGAEDNIQPKNLEIGSDSAGSPVDAVTYGETSNSSNDELNLSNTIPNQTSLGQELSNKLPSTKSIAASEEVTSPITRNDEIDSEALISDPSSSPSLSSLVQKKEEGAHSSSEVIQEQFTEVAISRQDISSETAEFPSPSIQQDAAISHVQRAEDNVTSANNSSQVNLSADSRQASLAEQPLPKQEISSELAELPSPLIQQAAEISSQAPSSESAVQLTGGDITPASGSSQALVSKVDSDALISRTTQVSSDSDLKEISAEADRTISPQPTAQIDSESLSPSASTPLQPETQQTDAINASSSLQENNAIQTKRADSVFEALEQGTIFEQLFETPIVNIGQQTPELPTSSKAPAETQNPQIDPSFSLNLPEVPSSNTEDVISSRSLESIQDSVVNTSAVSKAVEQINSLEDLPTLAKSLVQDQLAQVTNGVSPEGLDLPSQITPIAQPLGIQESVLTPILDSPLAPWNIQKATSEIQRQLENKTLLDQLEDWSASLPNPLDVFSTKNVSNKTASSGSVTESPFSVSPPQLAQDTLKRKVEAVENLFGIFSEGELGGLPDAIASLASLTNDTDIPQLGDSSDLSSAITSLSSLAEDAGDTSTNPIETLQEILPSIASLDDGIQDLESIIESGAIREQSFELVSESGNVEPGLTTQPNAHEQKIDQELLEQAAIHVYNRVRQLMEEDSSRNSFRNSSAHSFQCHFPPWAPVTAVIPKKLPSHPKMQSAIDNLARSVYFDLQDTQRPI